LLIANLRGPNRLSIDIEKLMHNLAAQVNSYLPSALSRLGGPDRLREAMAYSLLAPGKRLRPILVMLAADAVGGTRSKAMPAAAAVEFVHTYSLIHDDLPAMDDDDLRRGRPTCHKQFDDATAILAGDALLTGAFQILAESYSADVAAACIRELAAGAGTAGMVGGQFDDLAAEKKTGASIDVLEAIHRRKTGALIAASLKIGAMSGCGDRHDLCPDRVQRNLDDYGQALGLAFQITDDLLDVESRTEVAGKGVGKDAERGKLTYPGLLGVEESRRRAAIAVQAAKTAAACFGKAGEPLAALAGCLLGRRQ
jgi:geranylgeranyl diphosphate synthase type II